ncbi:serine hydrolase [Nevskia soli]|uniref:serine hydrolase n=1 Tax=Nevskia soli TaxID=418856 RepID=UPI000AE81A94|nr:serine hydrolase [Nevskia soli]
MTDVTFPPRSLQSRMPYLYGLILALSMLLVMAPTPAEARAADLSLKSFAVLVVDQDTGEALISKNADVVVPIASLTKLMTALVVLDAHQPMDEILEIGNDDVDREKHTRSRLVVGTRLSRSDMLLLALMSSENRAAMALSRSYPGGRTAFIAKMNAKARALGMNSSHFADPAGLSSETTSTARDLMRLVNAADAQPVIRDDSTQTDGTVLVRRHQMTFVNTNRMVRNNRDWDIELQKTGFTNEAGRCLVMRATTLNHTLSMVFLNSVGTLTRFADAKRVREHLEQRPPRQLQRTTTVASATKGTS